MFPAVMRRRNTKHPVHAAMVVKTYRAEISSAPEPDRPTVRGTGQQIANTSRAPRIPPTKGSQAITGDTTGWPYVSKLRRRVSVILVVQALYRQIARTI